jgi:hypothetical protein
MTAHALLALSKVTEAPSEARAAAQRYLLDSARALDVNDRPVPGWPFTPGTAPWVEPTAWAVLALSVAGRADHPRVAEAVDMLASNVSRGGGWSLYESRPFPYHTGLVLLALEACGRAPAGVVGRALSFLESPAARSASALDGAFRLWALSRARSAQADEALAHLVGLRTGAHSMGAGPFETAASALALASAAGEDRVLGRVREGWGR